MKTKTILATMTALGSMIVMSTTANADHTWSTYHWARTSNPIPLETVDSVTSDWQADFEEAMDDWNQSSVLQMPIVAGSESRKDRKRCTPVSGKMRVCNAEYGANGWLGLASINLDSNGHITQGTAKLNDSYSNYWTNYPGEKLHVMCQEIGHVFGLGHTSEDGSSQGTCMDYSSGVPASWKPNAHDFEQLAAMYDHLDSYNSYADGNDPEPPCRGGPRKCGSNFDGSLPPGAVRVRKNNFSEVWVKSGPNGGMAVFHIRLAPGEELDHEH